MLLAAPDIVSIFFIGGSTNAIYKTPCIELTPNNEVGRPDIITLKDKIISAHGGNKDDIFFLGYIIFFKVVFQSLDFSRSTIYSKPFTQIWRTH